MCVKIKKQFAPLFCVVFQIGPGEKSCNDMDCGDQDCFDSTNGVGQCADNCVTKNCEDHQTCEMLHTPCAAPLNDGSDYWCYAVAVCKNPGFFKIVYAHSVLYVALFFSLTFSHHTTSNY